jgi:hypothetical protein
VNQLRKAAEAGARVVRIVQKDPKSGKVLTQRVNVRRREEREMGLSGRQLRKLRKEARREERLILHGDPSVPAPQGVIDAGGVVTKAVPRRPPSPRPGP